MASAERSLSPVDRRLMRVPHGRQERRRRASDAQHQSARFSPLHPTMRAVHKGGIEVLYSVYSISAGNSSTSAGIC